jgi:serine/alanine adding enzyme
MSAHPAITRDDAPMDLSAGTTPQSIRIRPHTATDDAAWDSYAAAHPGYTIYHGRAFHAAVFEAFGMVSQGFIAESEEGRVVGLLPLVRQKSMLFGDRLVSLPYANPGGPLADAPAIALRLLGAAAEHASALGCNRIEVRDPEPRECDWPMHTDKVVMTRRLPGSVAELDKELGAKLRSQCRRALKEQASVQIGSAELIPGFYQVFAASMRDLGTPVYPRRWFEVLARHFGEQMKIMLVSLDGRPAAGAVLVRWKDTLEIPWAASAREFNRYSVNMLLYRAALDHGIESGCRSFDFGRSSKESGTWRFKRQWGAEETQIYWRTHPDAGKPGRASEFVRRAWTRLPLPVANWLGSVVAPGLPW